MDSPEFGDTPVSRCKYYREVLGLRAVIDRPEIGRIVVPASEVHGVMMPASFGQMARARMECAGNAVGPIVGYPSAGRWLWLVQPDIPGDGDMKSYAEMFRRDVSIVRDGKPIALPSPTASAGRLRRWVIPPRTSSLPSGLVVLRAVGAWADFAPVRQAVTRVG